MSSSPMIPFPAAGYSPEETSLRAREFMAMMQKRRSLRHFSDRPVSKAVMEDLVKTAAAAPSGAHKQPWTFCLVGDPEKKKLIREAAEAEEYENYHGRMSDEWLEDLRQFDTNWKKPFLETAPWLVVIFKKPYDIVDGEQRKNYYVSESVGLAAGILITAIHNAGLACLTHTPSPMNFLQNILDRPANERPFLLLPVGYPAKEASVPDLNRKPIEEILFYY